MGGLYKGAIAVIYTLYINLILKLSGNLKYIYFLIYLYLLLTKTAKIDLALFQIQSHLKYFLFDEIYGFFSYLHMQFDLIE